MNFKRFIQFYLLYIFKTIYFNFHYLPFTQAIRLPILLSKPKLYKCKGKVIIEADKISFGMILLGSRSSDMYPNTGIFYKNLGGTILFKGTCKIGNASHINVLNKANLIFGNDFISRAQFKVTCSYLIEFGDNARIGWENIFIDTSFHRIKTKNGDWKKGKPFAEIRIGRNNWLGLRCTVYKGTKTPDYCIFGGNSILNTDYSNNPSYILMAGNPLTVKMEDVWRDTCDDVISKEG